MNWIKPITMYSVLFLFLTNSPLSFVHLSPLDTDNVPAVKENIKGNTHQPQPCEAHSKFYDL